MTMTAQYTLLRYPYTRFRRWLLLSAALLLTVTLSAPTLAGQLSASADRTRISLEETLNLVVRYDEQVIFGEPDFSQLKQQFEILANRRANQYRSVNGKAESWTQWTLTLAPKQAGSLQIPAFEFEGARSKPLTIEVQPAAAATAPGSDQPVFLETELSKSSVYVQEQLLLTYRLYTSVDLSGLNSEELSIDNALVKQVAENQYQRTIDGKRYGVVEVSYAIFPQQSGNLVLPPTLWNVTLQSRQGFDYDPFFNRGGKRLRLKTEEKFINVLPKPDAYSSSHWLPATDITLSQSWSRDPKEFKVGEPITRKVVINARGLMASQIPALEPSSSADIKYYPDLPQSEESVSSDGVTSVITESYAIVPARAGQLTLPAIQLDWWDTEQKQQRQAVLPAQTINVRGGVEAATTGAATPAPQPVEARPDSAPTSVATTATSSPALASLWFYLTLLLAATTLLFALLWLRARATPRPQEAPGSPTTGVTEKVAFRRLQQSLNGNDNRQIRAALLDWARARFSPTDIHSLTDLAERVPELQEAIAQLESSLYAAGEAQFDRRAMLDQLQQWRRQAPAAANPAETALPPLYS